MHAACGLPQRPRPGPGPGRANPPGDPPSATVRCGPRRSMIMRVTGRRRTADRRYDDPASAPMIAEATGRLAAAGVDSPRADAELLAAYVLGVSRGRLPLVDTVQPPSRPVRPRSWSRGGPTADPVAAPDRHGAVPPSGARGRPGRVRAAAGDRAAGRLGHRAGPRGCHRGGRPVRGTGRDRALGRDRGAGGDRVYAVERSPAALVWLRRNAAERGSGRSTVVGAAT